MTDRQLHNAAQRAVWNDAAGEAWVANADHFDATLAPFGEAAIAALTPQADERVVDLGCGAGATTIRLAALCAPGEVVGIDLSRPLLDLAQRRAEASGVTNVRFAMADVQADALDSAPFDAAFSRFGLMFFDDPLAAFARVAGSLVPGGRLAFVCFGGPAENAFITMPVGAAMQALGVGPPAPGGPNPFSLADCDATAALLAGAGFGDVEITPGPTEAVVGTDDDLDALAARVIAQNPTTSAALARADEATRAAAVSAAAHVLAGHCAGGLVVMPARTWVVRARRS